MAKVVGTVVVVTAVVVESPVVSDTVDDGSVVELGAGDDEPESAGAVDVNVVSLD
jgi:hypothetical protein